MRIGLTENKYDQIDPIVEGQKLYRQRREVASFVIQVRFSNGVIVPPNDTKSKLVRLPDRNKKNFKICTLQLVA